MTASIFLNGLQYLGYILIFQGFLFCFLCGLLLSGIDPGETAPMGIESYADVTSLLAAAELEGKSITVIPRAGSVVPVLVPAGE